MNRLIKLISSPLTWGVATLGLCLYWMPDWVWPGEGATILAQCTGAMEAGPRLPYPLVQIVFGAVAKLLPATCWVRGFNLLAAVMAAVGVMVAGQLVRNFLGWAISEGYSAKRLPLARALGSLTTGIGLISAFGFILAGSHFQVQLVHGVLGCVATWAVVRSLHCQRGIWLGSVAFGLGLILLESSELFALGLVLLLWHLLNLIFAERASEKNIADKKTDLIRLLIRSGVCFLVGILVFIVGQLAVWMSHGYEGSIFGAIVIHGMQLLAGCRSWFVGPWLLIVLFCVLPSVLAFSTCCRVGNNDRRLVAILTYISTCVLLGIGLYWINGPLLSLYGETYPIVLIFMMCIAMGLLSGMGGLLVTVKHRAEDREYERDLRGFGRLCGVLFPFALSATAIGTGLWSAWGAKCVAAEQLPRTLTHEILADIKDETWLLGDGVLNPYLALAIAEQQLPVTLFSIAEERDPATLRRLQASLINSTYFSERTALRERLVQSLDLGVVPFLQDWIKADAGSETHFVTLTLPDIWLLGERTPVPDRLWFRGCASLMALKSRYLQTLPSLAPYPMPEANVTLPFSVRMFVEAMRRHASLVANDTGFYLIEADQKEAAYTLCHATYLYHPDNVCALFNVFELVHGGIHPEMQPWCEQEVQNILRKMKGRKYLWVALARTYGYIHSPQLMSALAGNWVMTGQPGAALATLGMAYAMLPSQTSEKMQAAMAMLYSITPGKTAASMQQYEALLAHATDPKQVETYVHEMVRLALMMQDVAKARTLLANVHAEEALDTWAYDSALVEICAGDIAKANAYLTRCLDHNPKNLEALAMLATLQIQNNEMEALRKITLPKMTTAAGGANNYFVQIISAQIALYDQAFEKAREHYLRAYKLRSEVFSLREMILKLDIRLNDKASATAHAKEYLYQDRAFPLGNYVLGSIALGAHDLTRAEYYLSAATAPEVEHPLPEALNDLAETYRLLKQYPQALNTIDRALKASTHIPTIYETKAMILLQMGQLEEAMKTIQAALDLIKDADVSSVDPRLYMTQAEIYAAQHQIPAAQIALAKVRDNPFVKQDPEMKARYEELVQKIIHQAQ